MPYLTLLWGLLDPWVIVPIRSRMLPAMHAGPSAKMGGGEGPKGKKKGEEKEKKEEKTWFHQVRIPPVTTGEQMLYVAHMADSTSSRRKGEFTYCFLGEIVK